MSIPQLLQSEMGLTLIGGIIGSLWTLFKGIDFFQHARQVRLHRAVQALEAAVEETYRSYVEAIKHASEDGKLTSEERREARRLARETAIVIARREGIDILRELGDSYFDLWLSRTVNQFKKG